MGIFRPITATYAVAMNRLSYADDVGTKRAFSLVELLVVIAIISVLAALLLPTLAEGIEQARRGTCLNSQKQLYIGGVQYAADYDGWAPPGTNLSHGKLPMSPTRWARFDYFWNAYFSVNIAPSGRFATPQNLLLCPSGTRTAYTNSAASNTTLFNNLGWEKTVDYAVVGGAPNHDEIPYWPARINRWWNYCPNGPRAYCMDIAYTAGDAIHQERMVHRDSSGLPGGMNVIAVDGSGGWQSTERCTMFGGNRPDGCWQYVNWTYLMMPIKYEVLYTEWNYTYNWGTGGVMSARNGKSAPNYSGASVGLVKWP